MIELRDYQEDIIKQTRCVMQSGFRAPMIVAPCGAGKTIIFSYMAGRAAEGGMRVLILVHRKELVDQIMDTLGMFNIEHGVIAHGRAPNSIPMVQVASTQSYIGRMTHLAPPGLIIIDEAHHANLKSTLGRVLTYHGVAWRVGVTATPCRLSGEPLSDLFDTLVLGPTIDDLIARKALCPFRIFAPSSADMEGVKLLGGDYNRKQMEERVNTFEITGSAVTHYKRLCHGKRAVVFCASIEHAKTVAERFRHAGYPSACVHSKMRKPERDDVVSRFRSGRIKIMTNVSIVDEGFDLPSIECAIILRATSSITRWIQMTGRAMRVVEGKEEAIILDHVGNTQRLGFPNDDRSWTLDGTLAKPKTKQEAPVRICEQCFFAMPAGVAVCPACGAKHVVAVKEFTENNEDLVELTKQEKVRAFKQQCGQAKTIEQLIAVGKSRGMKNPWGWARHRMAARNRR